MGTRNDGIIVSGGRLVADQVVVGKDARAIKADFETTEAKQVQHASKPRRGADQADATQDGPRQTKRSSPQLIESVFIVHGHDEAMKHSVSRFIASIGLTPVVLHEQPNLGRTIIEKFEQNAAQAGFAVVLMSPDDVGASVKEPDVKRPRARQNVVMELGYFTGMLGRDRICVLISEGVEVPSDYMGVVYTPFDTGGAWKMALASELQSSGYQIEAAALIK